MPSPRLYAEFASWWHLLSAPEDYAEEAEIFRAALERGATGELTSLLELGSGGGNNASFLKRHYELTLVDPSAGMRAQSEKLNPECRHVAGDMRDLRLGQSFDAVLIHDAIMYMTSEADLRAAMDTAFAHLRPGGAALFVPDDTRETWSPSSSTGGHDADGRSLRYLTWSFDPDPADTTFATAYALLLRTGDQPVRCEYDEHTEGLFSRETWLSLMTEAGFEAETLPFRHSTFEAGAERELFLGRRG